MQIGIVGLPTVGKTTLFNLLTRARLETAAFGSGRAEAHTGMARVPDPRVDYLSAMFKPRKTTYAQIEFTEVPGLVRGASQGQGMGNSFLSAIRNVDALVHLVRVFAHPDVPHVDGSIDPVRDMETIDLELLFADLGLIEARIERIEQGKKKKEQEAAELAVMHKLKAALEAEQPIHAVELDEAEQVLVRNYAFLTEKPAILVVNLDEQQFHSRSWPRRDEVLRLAAARNTPVMEICAQMEMEISQLEGEDRELFMADLGIAETGTERLARAVYDRLGLISFLTAGEDEARAWTIRRGTHARGAAGKIHSDIERGFIRAEVVAFADLQAAGSMAKAREQGKFRLEGRDYVVQDGDIINFRFNV